MLSAHVYFGKGGTLWYKSVPQVDRDNSASIYQQAPGPLLESRRTKTHLNSFLLLSHRAMVHKIVYHMDAEAIWVKGDLFDFSLLEDEFLAILGLLLVHGMLCANNEPLYALWSQDYDCDIFWHTIAKNRYSIMHFFLV